MIHNATWNSVKSTVYMVSHSLTAANCQPPTANRKLPTANIILLIFFIICNQGVNAGFPETVKQVKSGVVAIGTYQPTRSPPASFKGTGFAIKEGRHVVTNAHVLPDTMNSKRQESLAVFFRKGKKIEMRQATFLAKDKKHDLAILKISGKPLKTLKLGDDSKVREGQLYGFTGFPIGMVLGLAPVTHRGIVSAITPIVIPATNSSRLDLKHIRRMNDPYDVFQLDATAYPGNSGSPLYDVETGRVVGVINSVFVKGTKESVLTAPSGISYAIPARYIKKLLRKVK